ncbi:DUF6541 family protein [Pseudarthrobacter sp. L19]|uniref:DUF6541 family protein n=1 Tax=Pseudarthrobacter sp. L19 TaxID=3423951 RepID=UPI003D7BB981
MIYAELAPLVCAAIAVLAVPGLLVSWAAGARGWTLAGAAAPVSVSVISVTAVLTGFVGLPWGMLVVTAVAVVLAAALFLLRRLFPRTVTSQGVETAGALPRQRSNVRRRERWKRNGSGTEIIVGWLAVGVVFLLLFWRLAHIFGGVDNISQTFDNVFHLNAVRYIVDTGNASSLRVSGFTSSTGMGGFYPAAWHDVASLTQQLTGSTVPAAVNATNVAISGLVWPLSCLLLATSLFGHRRIVVVTAAAMSAGFSSFPYLMLDFGVLYPNLLSIALLPAAIGFAAMALRAAKGLEVPTLTAWLLAVGAVPGVALAHPSTLMALLAWTLPAVAAAGLALVRRWRGRWGTARSTVAVALGFAAYTAVLLVAWKLVRPDEAQSTWQPIQGLAQAFGQALTSAPQGRPIPWFIFAATLAGIWAMLRHRRQLWLLAMFAISCIMFIVVSGYPFGPFRTWFTGVWYNDPFRLAALLPVAALPVAALGVLWLADDVIPTVWNRIGAAGDRVRALRVSASRSKAASAAAALVAFAGVLLLTQGGTVSAAVASAAGSYALTPASRLVDSNEMKLLVRAGQEIPADIVVVSSPWTGASMVYAIADRKSLTPHIFSEFGADTSAILNRLNQAGTDPKICDIVRKMKTYYVLDFGTREIHGAVHTMPGLVGMDTNPEFSLVDHEGEAKLYKVTSCGQ